MKRCSLILSFAFLLGRCGAAAQGTFENLDFEQAKIIINPDGFISTSNAFPGWTVLAGGSPWAEVDHDNVGPNVAGIADSSGMYGPLDGRFSALLGGRGLFGVPTAIEQSATIPTDAESMTFLALGQFDVFLNGQSIPVEPLGSGDASGEIYGANISSYAGQYSQLLFQTGPGGVYYLDDITFSTQSIPEPGVISMLGLGMFVFALRRSRLAAPALAPPGS